MWSPNLLLDHVGNLAGSALLPGNGTLSSEGVGHRILAAGDEGQERLVDRRIERRGFVTVEPGAAESVRPLLDALATLDFPLLERVVVGQSRPVEGRLEVRLRLGATEIMGTGTHFADRIPRLAAFAEIDAL